MGCCSSSNRVDWNDRLYHYPVASQERRPLPIRGSAASVIPTGLLVDTNLDTSIPDTYRHPPAPLPYDAIPPNNLNASATKHQPLLQTNDSVPIGDTKARDDTCENGAKGAAESVVADEVDTDLDKCDELKKSISPFVAPEECPTCLEEYDEENPKIVTKCEHHFHLSCILEWMERSNTCPLCDQEMELDIPIGD